MELTKIDTDSLCTTTQEEDIERLHDFYTIKFDNGGNIKSFDFSRLKICRKLMEFGFFRYDDPQGSFSFVSVRDNKVSIVSEAVIKDYFIRYIENLPTRIINFTSADTIQEVKISSEFILERIYKNLDSYFNLERLTPSSPIEMRSDTEKEKYMYYNNLFLRITSEGIQQLPYEQLDGYVWNGNILDRDFIYTDTIGDFEKFIGNVCGKDAQRKKCLMSYIGYLLHNHFETSRKMIIFTDECRDGSGIDLDTDGDSGGTGKSLLGKAINYVTNRDVKNDTVFVEIGGKTWDVEDEKKYITAERNTQIIFINDIKKGLSLEKMYNDVSDGIKVRKMHKAPFVIDAKMLMATNQTVLLRRSSDKRRVVFFEFANYYNEKHTPELEFGKWFWGSKWTQTDWAQFDSFMARCVMEYMQNGLSETLDINYSARSIVEYTSKDFVFWFKDVLAPALATKQETRFEKKELYAQFVLRYPDYMKYSQRKITDWIKLYLDKKAVRYVELRGTSDYIAINPDPDTIDKARKANTL